MTELARLARIFKALGDESRLAILAGIHGREIECTCGDACCAEVATVSDVAAEVDVSLPTISYHLKELVAAGLVETRRNGRRVFCRTDRAGLDSAAEFIKELSK